MLLATSAWQCARHEQTIWEVAMKKHVLMVTLQLLLCSMVFGQTDNPGCSVGVSVTDIGCTLNQENCNFATGCTSSNQFHMQCSGTGWIKAWVECGEGVDCRNCAVCVSLVTAGDGTVVATCGTLDVCSMGTCCVVCTPYVPSGDYIIRVCLVPCPGGDRNACCSGACKARVAFSSNPLTCPW